MSTTPDVALANAKCFNCLDDHELLAIIAYTTAVTAGAGTDPTTLLALAKCFICLSEQQLYGIIAYNTS